MLSSRKIEFDLDIADRATPKYYKFTDEVKAGAADIQSNINAASKAFDEHGKHVSKVTEFYKTQRSENRLQSFYFSQSKTAINALTFGMLALMNSQDSTDATTKKLNQSLMSGFAAFQGLDFLLAGLGAGPWGLVIAGIGGVTAALLTMGKDDAKKASENLKLLNDEIDKFGQGAGLKETTRERDALTAVIKANEGAIKKLNDEQFVLNHMPTSEENEKESDSIKDKIKFLEIENRQKKIAVDELQKLIDTEKQAATVKTRQTGSPEGQLEAAKKTAEERAKLDKEWFEERFKQQKSIDEIADKSFKENYDAQVKSHDDAMNSISQMEKNTFRQDKDYELKIVDDWLAKVKTSYGMTQDDITRAEEIAAERRSQIELQSFQKTFQQYNALASRSFAMMQQASAQNYQSQLDDIEEKKEAELAAIDHAMASENISASQKKKLEKEKQEIEKKYRDQEKQIKKQQWEADKEARLGMAIIEGAEAVVKALPNIPLAIITASMAAAQIAIISSQKAPKFQYGTPPGGFEVPGGYPNDNYPVYVSSGEKVHVTPKGKSSSGAGGGTTLIVNINSPIPHAQWVAESLKQFLEDSGSDSITDLIVNNRKGYTF